MSSVVSGIFGSGSDAGVLGTGQFKANKYKIDRDAFGNPTYQEDRDYATGQRDVQAGRSQTGWDQSQDARAQQARLASALEAQMRGEGPSLAQQQLRSATDRNVAQAAGMAASNRNVNPALAARMQGQNVATANQQAAGDSAQLRAAEALSAQQQMAGLSSQMRGQDLSGVSGANTNQRAQQQAAIDLSEQERAARIAREQLEVQNTNAVNSVNAGAYEGASGRRGDMVSNIGGGIASMFSDADMKTDIEPGKVKTQQFLDSIESGVDSGSGGSDLNSIIADQKAARDQKKQEQQQQMMQMASMAAMAFSDEDKKTDVKSGAEKTNSFLTKFAGALNNQGSGGGSLSKSEKKSQNYKKIGEGIGKMFGGSEGGTAGGAASSGGGAAAGGASAGGMGGFLAAMSDENSKTGVQKADSQINSFLSNSAQASAPQGDRAQVSYAPGTNASGDRAQVSYAPGTNASGDRANISYAPQSNNSAYSQAPAPTFAPSAVANSNPYNMAPVARIGQGFVSGQSQLPPDLQNRFRGGGDVAQPMSISDELLKVEIKGSDPKVSKFLDAINAHEYEYKKSVKDLPGAGEGKHVSPMAQELEKSELGKQMVIDTPKGKMVDYGKGFGTILAAQAVLNKRLNDLEKKKGK